LATASSPVARLPRWLCRRCWLGNRTFLGWRPPRWGRAPPGFRPAGGPSPAVLEPRLRSSLRSRTSLACRSVSTATRPPARRLSVPRLWRIGPRALPVLTTAAVAPSGSVVLSRDRRPASHRILCQVISRSLTNRPWLNNPSVSRLAAELAALAGRRPGASSASVGRPFERVGHPATAGRECRSGRRAERVRKGGSRVLAAGPPRSRGRDRPASSSGSRG